jgi:hypothetical protein
LAFSEGRVNVVPLNRQNNKGERYDEIGYTVISIGGDGGSAGVIGRVKKTKNRIG